LQNFQDFGSFISKPEELGSKASGSTKNNDNKSIVLLNEAQPHQQLKHPSKKGKTGSDGTGKRSKRQSGV